MARDAEYFDNFYSNIVESPSSDRIVAEALGLPPDLQATGNLPWAAIDDIVAVLVVDVGAVLVDLGCGRGGYGIEVVRRTGSPPPRRRLLRRRPHAGSV